jgi:hypothetical protein
MASSQKIIVSIFCSQKIGKCFAAGNEMGINWIAKIS